MVSFAEVCVNSRNIIIVDDHPLVADAFSGVLSGLGFAVRCASTARDLRRYLAEESPVPDLIILDIGLPDADGVDLVSEIHARHQLPILIFSGQSEWATIQACERNGASGFLCKSAKPNELLSGIDAVLSGGQFFPAAYIKAGRQPRQGLEALNERQFQVLDLVIEGNTNKSIADNVGLAVGTVKNIVTELLQHFDVESRQKLMLVIQKLGYKARLNRAAKHISAN
jgi:DNA-binding NarL/FixJ family response regulator